jgi:hypothetical protein
LSRTCARSSSGCSPTSTRRMPWTFIVQSECLYDARRGGIQQQGRSCSSWSSPLREAARLASEV